MIPLHLTALPSSFTARSRAQAPETEPTALQGAMAEAV